MLTSNKVLCMMWLHKGYSMQYIAEKLNKSVATVHNLAVQLEEAGYITQPRRHAAKSRRLTDEGWRYMRENGHVVEEVQPVLQV